MFPPQDPIQQIMPPWIYNDSLVPGKATSGHLARWAVQSVNVPVLAWPLTDQSLIPSSKSPGSLICYIFMVSYLHLKKQGF